MYFLQITPVEIRTWNAWNASPRMLQRGPISWMCAPLPGKPEEVRVSYMFQWQKVDSFYKGSNGKGAKWAVSAVKASPVANQVRWLIQIQLLPRLVRNQKTNNGADAGRMDELSSIFKNQVGSFTSTMILLEGSVYMTVMTSMPVLDPTAWNGHPHVNQTSTQGMFRVEHQPGTRWSLSWAVMGEVHWLIIRDNPGP